MDAGSLDGLLLKLRANEITGDAFLRATREHWRLEAMRLYRRWRRRLPEWVEPEDVEQAMLENVIFHVDEDVRKAATEKAERELVNPGSTRGEKVTARRLVDLWDPARGTRISDFVSFGARTRTRRAIHKMRGARLHGTEGKNPSNYETSFSKYSARRKMGRGDEGGREVDPCDLVPVRASQDERAAVREILTDAVAGAHDMREALVLLALREAGGDPDDAAVALHQSFAARVECEIRSVEHAEKVVSEVIQGALGVRAA